MAMTIVVPLDGSALAERAIPYAEALARPGAGSLVLVRTVPYLARPSDDRYFRTLAAAREAAGDEARHYLACTAARLAGRGVAVRTAVPYEAEADGILAEARAAGADLIALATHGRSGLGRWLYGSVAGDVLASTGLPTLVVRSWLPEGGAGLLAAAPRILVPLDGSAANEAALPLAGQLAAACGGGLLLVRAVARPDLVLAPDFLAGPLLREGLDEERAAAERYLRDVATRVAADGYPVETAVRVGRPGLDMAAAVIEAVGRERDAALVVMTSHGRAGFERLLLGSVADATLRHGTLPVILVRP